MYKSLAEERFNMYTLLISPKWVGAQSCVVEDYRGPSDYVGMELFWVVMTDKEQVGGSIEAVRIAARRVFQTSERDCQITSECTMLCSSGVINSNAGLCLFYDVQLEM